MTTEYTIAALLDWVHAALNQRVIYVNTIADLQALPTSGLVDGQQVQVQVSGYYAANDGGGGPPRIWKTGAAGTYTGDGGSTILPIGGDGSGAWVWEHSGPVNVRWYGAKGDGSADDTAAVQSAIEFSAQQTYKNKIYIPTGLYIVTSENLFGVFTGQYVGLHVVGDGPRETVLSLNSTTAGKALYLYNTQNKLQNPLFEYIQFRAEGSSVFGFEMSPLSGSSFPDQNFTFNHCMFFGSWASVMKIGGDTNASENRFNFCRFFDNNCPVLDLNNVQAVNNSLADCDITSPNSDIIRVGAGGGGYVTLNRVNIAGWNPASLSYVFNITGSSLLGRNNNKFTAIDIRVEAMNQNGAFLLKSGSSGECIVNVTRGGFQALNGARNIVDIDLNTRILFKGTHLDSDSLLFIGRGSTTGVISQHGDITFEDCQVSTNLSDNITALAARARNCWNKFTGDRKTIIAQDFDLRWDVSSFASGQPREKTAILRQANANWPKDEGDGTPGWESTCKLPVDARITGIYVHKPSASVNTEPYQLKVGSDDKATIYASSVEAGYSAAHTIDETLSVNNWINVGSSINLRTVRLWADPLLGNTSNQSGGTAIITYI